MSHHCNSYRNFSQLESRNFPNLIQRIGQPLATSTHPVGLLVSVRNPQEAVSAWKGGARVIDVKEPLRGSLGKADHEILTAICNELPEDAVVTAALGEATGLQRGMVGSGGKPWCAEQSRIIAAFKVGPAGMATAVDYGNTVSELAKQTGKPFVFVGYADHVRANAPSVEELMLIADQFHATWFLIDTFLKDGKGLLEWYNPSELAWLCERWRQRGGKIALAGSLNERDAIVAASCRPNLVAVRGAACVGGRLGTVSQDLVAKLVEGGDFSLEPITL